MGIQDRNGLLPTEAVARGREIEERERPAAAQRQRESRLAGAGTRVREADGRYARRPSVHRLKPKRRGRWVGMIAAAALGMSEADYHRARAVVLAAERDPERFGDLLDLMDQTGNVNRAYREILRRQGEGAQEGGPYRSRDSFNSGYYLKGDSVDISPDQDATSLAKSQNFLRSHYKSGQRAMYAAKLATLKLGDVRSQRAVTELRQRSGSEAAQALNVSRDLVVAAKQIRREADPAVVQAVEDGKLTLHAAEQIVKHIPKEAQAMKVMQVVADSAGLPMCRPVLRTISRP